MVLFDTVKNTNIAHRLSQPLSPSGGGVSPYLDRQANVAVSSEKSYCGQYAKVGSCGNGHHFLKVIYCNKEWCTSCREIAHNRRIARWLPKALTMDSFGYFVFTIPLEMREFYRDKKHLSELRTYLRKRLRQIYPDIKALARWHFFGANPYFYHPHLNVMVHNFEKLPKIELESIKRDYQSALEQFTGIVLDKKVDVYYHYYSLEGFKKQYAEKNKSLTDEQTQELYKKVLWHKLKYITRATFTVYNKELVKKLKNFRNGSTWGKFRELAYEEIEGMAKRKEVYSKGSKELILLEAGHCSVCGRKIEWQQKIKHSVEFLILYKHIEMGNGYYLLGEKTIRGSPVKLPSREKLRGTIEDLPKGRMFANV